MDNRKPVECWPWNEKVEKAKAFVNQWNESKRLRDVAESITQDEILKDIEVIRLWQHSQRFPSQQIG